MVFRRRWFHDRLMGDDYVFGEKKWAAIRLNCFQLLEMRTEERRPNLGGV